MKKYGLTNERYEQLMKSWNGDEEQIQYLVDLWGAEDVNKGYAVFDFDGHGIIQIERIDEVEAFEDDTEATEQAIKDGVKIIPVEELPENFDRRYLGWIDTPENRKAIAEYTERWCK